MIKACHQFTLLIMYSYYRQKFMQIVLFHFLIVLGSGKQCPFSLPLSKSDSICDYFVDYLDSECQTPVFINCSVTTSAGSSPNASKKTKTYFHMRQECSLLCCSATSTFVFCSSTAQISTSKETVLLVVCIIGILVFIGIVGICFYKFSEEIAYFCSRICYKPKVLPGNQKIEHSNENINVDQTMNDLNDIEHKQWKQLKQQVKWEDCSVCLSDKPDLMLGCGHSFHRECIYEWFKRKQECILCRNQVLFRFKLFCHSCHQSYKRIYGTQIQPTSNIPVICDKCLLLNQSQTMKQ